MGIINEETGEPITKEDLDQGGIISEDTEKGQFTFQPGVDEGSYIPDPKRQRIAIIGVGRPVGLSLTAAMLQGSNCITERLIRGEREVNFEMMAEPGSPVEGKRLRNDSRRELVMNNTGTMTWPAPKQRRGRK